MGWSDVYPILTDEMVEEFENEVAVAEREQLDKWLGEADVINRRDLGHVVSVSLFWKNANCGDPDLPTPTRETMQSAKALGNVTRFDPWTHYVEPLLRGARRLREERKGMTVRVYLAADLNFLIEDLVEVGCEVRLMRHSSLRHAPGSLWRFLAFEDAVDLVTVLDSDAVNRSDAWLEQTERLRETGFMSYRRPRAYASEIDGGGYLVYRSVIAWPLGSRLRLPMGQLLRAFTWHARRGNFRTSVIYPGRGEVPIFGTTWPGYGFAEWFTSVALYPRLAEAGMITDVAAARDGGFFLPMDIEYATWANPDNCLACPVLPGPEGRAPEEGAVSDPMEAYRYWRETDRTSFSIGEDDYAFLVDFVRENQVKRVIEIGPGDSTWAFLENDCEVFSFEDDMAYLQRARERFSAYPSVNVMRYHDRVGLGLEELPIMADLVFVDGPRAIRESEKPARLEACRFAGERAPIVILHDAVRKGECEIAREMERIGWRCQRVDTKKGLFVFRRQVRFLRKSGELEHGTKTESLESFPHPVCRSFLAKPTGILRVSPRKNLRRGYFVAIFLGLYTFPFKSAELTQKEKAQADSTCAPDGEIV